MEPAPRDIPRRLPRGMHGLGPGVVAASQRTRLLEAVGGAVADKGYPGATIDDIVRGAGVSKKTFYDHFSDKLDCFLAAYEAASDELLARLREAQSSPDGWLERTRAGIVAYLRWLACPTRSSMRWFRRSTRWWCAASASPAAPTCPSSSRSSYTSTSPCSVALRQPQRVLGHVVQDHLARDGRGPGEAHAPPHVAEPVLEREPVAAVRLDRAVHALDRRLGGRVLGHVRGLARAGRGGVVERRRLLHHQARQLQVHLGLRERVGDALVGADGRAPHGRARLR